MFIIKRTFSNQLMAYMQSINVVSTEQIILTFRLINLTCDLISFTFKLIKLAFNVPLMFLTNILKTVSKTVPRRSSLEVLPCYYATHTECGYINQCEEALRARPV